MIASMAPIMLKEGYTYREIANALTNHFYNGAGTRSVQAAGMEKGLRLRCSDADTDANPTRVARKA